MRVVLEAEVFANANIIDLDALCRFGLEGRHRIQVDSCDSPHFVQWLERLTRDHSEEWLRALHNGELYDALEPSHFELRIAPVTHSEWAGAVPRLTLDDALPLLQEPFEVLLEDDETDRAFLLAMAELEERNFLLQFEQRKFLRFEHGGGLDKMCQKVNRKSGNTSYGRYWVLFDSDALRPGEPSESSEKLRQACETQVPHHQLVRRSIENYLPKNALHAWTYSLPRRKRQPRAERFKAFVSMNEPQRHHFNMKEGFEKDAKRKGQSAGDLYDDLTDETRRHLARGFGRNIAKLFLEDGVKREDLRKDGGFLEVNPAVAALIGYMR